MCSEMGVGWLDKGGPLAEGAMSSRDKSLQPYALQSAHCFVDFLVHGPLGSHPSSWVACENVVDPVASVVFSHLKAVDAPGPW